MNKFIFGSIVALALASSAEAATVTLIPQTCGTTQTCTNVSNTSGLNLVYLNVSSTYGRAVLDINGVLFDSGLHMVPNYLNLQNVPLYDPAGHTVLLTASFSVYYTRVVSGRGQSNIPHYNLVSGSLLTQ